MEKLSSKQNQQRIRTSIIISFVFYFYIRRPFPDAFFENETYKIIKRKNIYINRLKIDRNWLFQRVKILRIRSKQIKIDDKLNVKIERERAEYTAIDITWAWVEYKIQK